MNAGDKKQTLNGQTSGSQQLEWKLNNADYTKHTHKYLFINQLYVLHVLLFRTEKKDYLVYSQKKMG